MASCLFEYMPLWHMVVLSLKQCVGITISFTCQLDWVKECPDIWLDIISRCEYLFFSEIGQHLNQWTE